ncbi:MAG: M20/M25/M40 family metallo-hydrolase [Lachnospiraceae bacterium]|nr:M20/M25/M40 family metallo-hydrolase [Lachnospiraceae bacterium]
MDKKELLQFIDDRKDDLFKTLCDLIKIESVNYGSHGDEKEIAEYLGAEYEKYGFKGEVYSPLSIEGIENHPDYYPGRHLENRYNASVTVPGTCHDKRLMLAAHIDTEILGDRSTWTMEPLCGDIHDGSIWGRGAGDDKSGVAVAWFLIRIFKEAGIELPYDLVFTAYCDEEGGGGNGTLAACLKYPSDDVLNLDCEHMQIVSGGAGGACLAADFVTKEPVDTSEIMLTAFSIYAEEMAKFRQRRHDELMEYPRFARSTIPDEAYRIQDIMAGGTLSLNRGRINSCFYTTKSEKEINKEFAEITDTLNERLDSYGVIFEGFRFTTRFFRFAEVPEDNTSVELLKKAYREVTGREQEDVGSCLSDLTIYMHNCTKNSVCFGVGGGFGEYGGAHQPDEHIGCDELLEFAKILASFMMDYR